MMMSDRQAMLLVRAMAIQAKIEAMKAENAGWAARGESPCYGESSFLHHATDLEQIAGEME